MTIRLSIIRVAGMARTLVAVGICSEAFMFLTTAAAAPRSTWLSGPGAFSAAGAGAAGGGRPERGQRPAAPRVRGPGVRGPGGRGAVPAPGAPWRATGGVPLVVWAVIGSG